MLVRVLSKIMHQSQVLCPQLLATVTTSEAFPQEPLILCFSHNFNTWFKSLLL